MTITQKQVLHDILCAVSGFDAEHVINMYSNRPKPTVPFLTVEYRSHRTEVMSETGKMVVNADGTVTERPIYVRRNCFVEVQLIGGDADTLSLITDKLFTPTQQGTMTAADFCVFDLEAVRDLSAFVNKANYEKRASVDLRVRYTSIITDDVTDIQEVVIGSTVGDLPEDSIDIKKG